MGLVWRNARWVIHLQGGGNPDLFVDKDPWMPTHLRDLLMGQVVVQVRLGGQPLE